MPNVTFCKWKNHWRIFTHPTSNCTGEIWLTLSFTLCDLAGRSCPSERPTALRQVHEEAREEARPFILNPRLLYFKRICDVRHPFLPRCMECRIGLAMRILSICPSVRPSVKCVDWDKTEERSDQIFFIPYERSFSLVFWENEWLVGRDPFYLTFWVNRPR